MLENAGDILLSSGHDWQFDVIAARTQVDGVPRQRFRKQVIRVGDYAKSDGVKFSVTPAFLSHWVDTFKRMKENGTRVSIPSSHEAFGDSEKNMGWVEDLFIEGDSLVMSCELIGEDAFLAAARNNVSLGIPVKSTDALGNTYDRPIEHIAMTPVPVIPGMDSFERVTLSKTRKAPEMKLDGIQKELGIKTALTDTNAQDEIVKAFKGQGALALSEAAVVLEAGELKDVSELKLAIDLHVDKKVAAGIEEFKTQAKQKPIDPHLRKLCGERCELMLSELVKNGRATPATKDALKALFLSETELNLSLSSAGGTDKFDALVKIFAGNDPVELRKSRTGPQTEDDLHLSDPMRGNKSSLEQSVQKSAEAAMKKDPSLVTAE